MTHARITSRRQEPAGEPVRLQLSPGLARHVAQQSAHGHGQATLLSAARVQGHCHPGPQDERLHVSGYVRRTRTGRCRCVCRGTYHWLVSCGEMYINVRHFVSSEPADVNHVGCHSGRVPCCTYGGPGKSAAPHDGLTRARTLTLGL